MSEEKEESREKLRREQLVDDLICSAMFCSYRRDVGAVVSRLKGKDAERVKTLTADDFNHPNRIKIV